MRKEVESKRKVHLLSPLARVSLVPRLLLRGLIKLYFIIRIFIPTWSSRRCLLTCRSSENRFLTYGELSLYNVVFLIWFFLGDKF